jgi:hypothetical protein
MEMRKDEEMAERLLKFAVLIVKLSALKGEAS